MSYEFRVAPMARKEKEMALSKVYSVNPQLFNSFCEELKKAYGGFMRVTDVCDYHRCSVNTAKKYMKPFRQYQMAGANKCIRTVDYAKYLAEQAAGFPGERSDQL